MDREHGKTSHEFEAACLCQIPQLSKALKIAYKIYIYIICVLFFFEAFFFCIIFPRLLLILILSSKLFVTQVYLDLRNDIQHLFCFSLPFPQSPAQKYSPARSNCMSSFYKIQCYSHHDPGETPKERFWMLLTSMHKEETLESKRLTFLWNIYCLKIVKWKCFQKDLFFRAYSQAPHRQRALFA